MLPSLWTHGRSGNASRLHVGPLHPRRGPKGIQPRGGSKSGKVTALPGHCPDAPSTFKAESPGKSRLAALESGFSSFRAEMASMFASLQGRLTVSHPPGPKADESRQPVIATGVLAVEVLFPKIHLLASSPVRGCWARRPCHSLVGLPGVT